MTPGFTPAGLAPGQAVVGPEVLAGRTAPTGQERVSQYLAGVKSELAAAGLPTRAPNARIALVNEAVENDRTLMDHGQAVARAIAGPIGLAQGAEIRYSQLSPRSMTPDLKAMGARLEVADRLEKGQGTLPELAQAYAKALPGELRSYRDTLESAASTLSPSTDGSTRLLLNLSSGASIAQAALVHTVGITKNKLEPGTPLYQELERRLGPPDPEKQWAPRDVAALLRDDMREAVKGSQGEIDAVRSDLATTVANLRERGAVVFAATGNDGEMRSAHPEDALNFNVVPGMIMVGATDIGDPKNPNDDQVAPFSTGARGYTTISTVGADVPVGPNGELEDGTSVATPIAVSIAALMTEANPKLTPDDIEAIMTHPSVARALPGERGGAGEVDPVAAVKLAKTWPPRA
jgi:subtilisin family serine protease